MYVGGFKVSDIEIVSYFLDHDPSHENGNNLEVDTDKNEINFKHFGPESFHFDFFNDILIGMQGKNQHHNDNQNGQDVLDQK